jgi:uncharacterized repeat protein (TIGR03803 family)
MSSRRAPSISASLLFLLVFCAFPLLCARSAPAQTETILHNFGEGSDGDDPGSGLIWNGGNLYGTTLGGGTGLSGTVFELSPSDSGTWNETILNNFCSTFVEVCPNGAYPFGTVIFDNAGNLYGTTESGGNTNCVYTAGCGVVFELSPSGSAWTETVLHAFCSPSGSEICPGGLPNLFGGSPVMDASGNIYTGDNQGVVELSPAEGAWT